MKLIEIGLLGFGTVGRGVWEVIEKNRVVIAEKTGFELHVKKVLDIRDVDLPEGVLTHDIDDIISDDNIEIVVEVVGGVDPAFDYQSKALKAGKKVITANKELLAKRGNDLFLLAKENKTVIGFEASVGGAIPVIHTVHASLTANRVDKFYGIINGTTNYILTKMRDEKQEFDEALVDAQALGYAEAAPAADIEGYDVAYKAALLSAVTFRKQVDINKMHIEGITSITKEEIRYADKFGYKVKMIGRGEDHGVNVSVSAYPMLVPSGHQLAGVDGVFNAIFVTGNASGDMMFYGSGAGSHPTASAIISDIILAADKEERDMPDFVLTDLTPIGDEIHRQYVRLNLEKKFNNEEEIKRIMSENDIAITDYHFCKRKWNIAIITEEIKEQDFDEVLKKVLDINGVEKIGCRLRVLS